ncbi:hypothetical protein SSX86_029962 [Deinandra increscens subsp. villosa]|uniref:MULE transposase domain-containing protein n=1 Tax=Deinandra increscens subsp. villosa TaxID=3103831 RepID=A0AAP0CAL4_9ASTR
MLGRESIAAQAPATRLPGWHSIQVEQEVIDHNVREGAEQVDAQIQDNADDVFLAKFFSDNQDQFVEKIGEEGDDLNPPSVENIGEEDYDPDYIVDEDYLDDDVEVDMQHFKASVDMEEDDDINDDDNVDEMEEGVEIDMEDFDSDSDKECPLKDRNGDYTAQYGLLRDYCDELLRSNPGSIVKIDVETECNPATSTRQFKRIYICFAAMKRIFKACGRDLIGLDGCFMKEPFPGQILTAVGVDSNNGIYPVAYAIVEAETISSWTWFLNCLGDDLDLYSNSNFTFISDRQKGIIPALSKVFPAAEHRFLRTQDVGLHQWLKEIPANYWSKSHFSGRAKCDILLNNLCEVFNRHLVGGRDKPIITCLEYIREYMMKRIVALHKVVMLLAFDTQSIKVIVEGILSTSLLHPVIC